MTEIRKPRNPAHAKRMARKRAMQLARTANSEIWKPKRIRRLPTGLWLYGRRGDEQKAYRAKHWSKANG